MESAAPKSSNYAYSNLNLLPMKFLPLRRNQIKVSCHHGVLGCTNRYTMVVIKYKSCDDNKAFNWWKTCTDAFNRRSLVC